MLAPLVNVSTGIFSHIDYVKATLESKNKTSDVLLRKHAYKILTDLIPTFI